jgi:hypothetical protein
MTDPTIPSLSKGGSRPGRLRDVLLSHDPQLSANRIDVVTIAAVAYLAIPNLIFLGGWLKPHFSIAFIGLLLLSLWVTARPRLVDWHWRHDVSATIVIIVFAFAWASFGGAGHLMHANVDWHMRDAVLADLTYGSWPVSYGVEEGRHVILRTALGYFLPAALAGKLMGAEVLDAALFLWTALGTALFLFLLPLPRTAGWVLLRLLAVVALFSGMDIVGFLIIQEGQLPMFPGRLEWYIPLSYSSLSAHLLWAPNHALAIWIATALFIRHWKSPDFAMLSIPVFALSFVWTPFAPITLAPFYLLLALDGCRAGIASRVRVGTFLAAAIGPLLLSVLVLRLLTSHFDLPVTVPSVAASGVASVAAETTWLRDYLLFVLVEFGILAIYVGRLLKHSHGLFWIACGTLALLPLLKFGPSNDLLLRASLPGLIVLMILAIAVLRQTEASSVFARRVILGILFLGFPTSISELWRSATFPKWQADYSISLPLAIGQGNLPMHYVAKLDRPDLLLLLRPPTIIPTRNERLQNTDAEHGSLRLPKEGSGR